MADVPKLPLFPLQTVLFPGALLPLRIFEPRYQALLAAITAKGADRRFGVCLIRVGEEVGGIAVPHRVGTEAEVVDIQGTGRDVSHILCRGGRRFEILELHDPAPYPRATVRYLPGASGSSGDATLVADALWTLGTLLEALRAAMDETLIDRLPRLPEGKDPEGVSYGIAAILPVEPPLRQELLEMDSSTPRLEREIEVMHAIITRLAERRTGTAG